MWEQHWGGGASRGGGRIQNGRQGRKKPLRLYLNDRENSENEMLTFLSPQQRENVPDVGILLKTEEERATVTSLFYFHIELHKY